MSAQPRSSGAARGEPAAAAAAAPSIRRAVALPAVPAGPDQDLSGLRSRADRTRPGDPADAPAEDPTPAGPRRTARTGLRGAAAAALGRRATTSGASPAAEETPQRSRTAAEPGAGTADEAEARSGVPAAAQPESQARGEGDTEREGLRAAASDSSRPPAEEDGDSGSPYRPKKPMLAAAALTGLVLLAVPLLLATQGEREDRASAPDKPVHDFEAIVGGDSPTAGVYAPDSSRDTPAPKTTSPHARKRGEEKAAAADDAPKDAERVRTDGGAPTPSTGKEEAAASLPRGKKKEEEATDEKKADSHEAPASDADSSRSASSQKSTAPRWETATRLFTNSHTGACLSQKQSQRFIADAACGPGKWQRLVLGGGYSLFKNPSTGMCLDTNEDTLYVSPCTDKDPGQRWRTPSAGGCTVYLVSIGGRYTTGWNTDGVSMRAKNDADTPAKQKWRVSPSLTSGC
ncbi:hypothetical protein [Streptomyces fumanus]|uniref:Ricin B lectin domain-containing protein n=1 Tax=Streptomyces fumanus TaxID=67302 RepID=A0A919AZL4_9ACTN|nr:hypothetical protein [Streptomyces fumanus]GHF34360.1 hypothetical protein GCM10018772_70010 [Streptomyces fumanus]